jgi:hypothetical protein
VRRDGTIETSSNPYARRADFPAPISMSKDASKRSETRSLSHRWDAFGGL